MRTTGLISSAAGAAGLFADISWLIIAGTITATLSLLAWDLDMKETTP